MISRERNQGLKTEGSQAHQCAAELSASPGQLSNGRVGFRQQRLLQAGQQRIHPETLHQRPGMVTTQW